MRRFLCLVEKGRPCVCFKCSEKDKINVVFYAL